MGAQRAILAADEEEPRTAESEPPCQLVTAESDHRPDCGPALEPSEEEIRLRSQEIWQREGCPEGYAEDHWQRARAELAALLEKTSNTQLAERPADDIAPPSLVQADDIVPAQSAAAPDTQAEFSAEDGENEAVPAAPLPLRLPTRSTQSAVVPTIICAGIVLRGTLESAGDIQFNGCMDGDIRCAVLAVDDEAVIQGEIVADEVTVRGRIQGRIRAHQVLLCAGSRVEGDILYGTLAIETGAQLDGSFQQENPQAQ
jgi:cytoskeletal protein CcmA (bactofilin family)